jgi:hypothetical protein
MSRWGSVIALAAVLAAIAGCGSSGQGERSQIPSPVQLRLGIGAQHQLRVQLRDQSIEVTDVRCGPPSNNVTGCVLQVVDGHGQRGTFGIGVRVDPKHHTVQLGFTGTSNHRWRALFERQARAQRRGQQGQRGVRTTP